MECLYFSSKTTAHTDKNGEMEANSRFVVDAKGTEKNEGSILESERSIFPHDQSSSWSVALIMHLAMQ